MNVFLQSEIANKYDDYYKTELGAKIDELEKKLISSLISTISTGTMLELGCGTGHWSQFFIEKGFNLTAIDTSEAMLNIAKGKSLQGNFEIGNAEQLPFENESFDYISSITMFEFVENQDKVLDEIYRVLKPNRWVILGFLNKESVLGKHKVNDETFKNANFLTENEIINKLSKFSSLSIKTDVYLDENFVLQEDSKKQTIAPVFIGVTAQKK